MVRNNKPSGEDVKVKEDLLYDALIGQSIFDNDCGIIISVILAALTKFVENKYKDFLPGGIYEYLMQ